MDKATEEELATQEREEQRRKWRDQFSRDHDKLTKSIGALENMVRRNKEATEQDRPDDKLSLRPDWTLKAFSELREHLQVFDALNEKVFALSETVRVLQKRLVVAEEELALLEKQRRIKELDSGG